MTNEERVEYKNLAAVLACGLTLHLSWALLRTWGPVYQLTEKLMSTRTMMELTSGSMPEVILLILRISQIVLLNVIFGIPGLFLLLWLGMHIYPREKAVKIHSVFANTVDRLCKAVTIRKNNDSVAISRDYLTFVKDGRVMKEVAIDESSEYECYDTNLIAYMENDEDEGPHCTLRAGNSTLKLNPFQEVYIPDRDVYVTYTSLDIKMNGGR